MQRNRLLVCVGLLVLALVAGCGGSSSSSLPGGGGGATTAPFSLTMRDDPPAGVDMISFEVNVIGATLGPNGPDLLAGKGPIEIEVKRLEVETAFLRSEERRVGKSVDLGGRRIIKKKKKRKRVVAE